MTRQPITILTRKKVDAYIETGSLVKTGRLTGNYKNDNSAKVSVYKAINRVTKSSPTILLPQLLDSVGLSDEALALKLYKKTNAKTKTYFSYNGIVTDEREQDNHFAQLKAIELACKLKGHMIERHQNLNLNINKNVSDDELSSMSFEELEYYRQATEAALEKEVG